MFSVDLEGRAGTERGDEARASATRGTSDRIGYVVSRVGAGRAVAVRGRRYLRFTRRPKRAHSRLYQYITTRHRTAARDDTRHVRDTTAADRPHDETADTTDETEKREITAIPHHHVVFRCALGEGVPYRSPYASHTTQIHNLTVTRVTTQTTPNIYTHGREPHIAIWICIRADPTRSHASTRSTRESA